MLPGWRSAWTWPVLLFICGCTAQLAPQYDQSIYDGLVSANKDIQALFVAASPATSRDTYPARAPAYDHIIAELNALDLQIKARPIPNPGALEQTNQLLAKAGVVAVDPKFSDYPSARAVEDLAETIAQMQRNDQTKGLQATRVLIYKQEAKISLSQAFAYENFLKR
jgi:hypothetical protein